MPTGEHDAVVPADRSPKSRHAYRTISEVAAEIDVPQHVLRFWETKFTQIRPLKRGGGRRYYRPEDVALLKGIRHLLYGDGYTIRGVQKVLRENGARAVMSVSTGSSTLLPPAAGTLEPDDEAGDLHALDPDDMADDSDFLAEDDEPPPEDDESEVEALRRLILDLRAELVEIRALLKNKN